jgi:hypothetical protein
VLCGTILNFSEFPKAVAAQKHARASGGTDTGATLSFVVRSDSVAAPMEYMGAAAFPQHGSTRSLSPNQGWVAHGHLPRSPERYARPGSSPPAAGARPPVSHHLQLGQMVPGVMAHSPSLEGTSYHRGWEHRPHNLLHVQVPNSHRDVPTAVGSPPRTIERSRTASRLPIFPTGGATGMVTPPESERGSREGTPREASPPRSGGSWMNLPVTTGVRGRERDVSQPHWGAAGAKPPASDHLMVGRGCAPAVGLRDSTHGGGGGVFFPRELQAKPSHLWVSGASRPSGIQQLRSSPTRLFSY